MNTGHTRGPWVNNGDGLVVHCFGDVAEVYDPADARLIAAAPELLEALQAAMIFLHPFGYMTELKREQLRCIEKARAAITKATPCKL